ncbi:MAG: transglutaminase family protein [Verrucomicrobiota bacterium]
MISYSITHKTIYRYQSPVACSHHVARLKAVSNFRQSCEAFQLAISPEPEQLIERVDYFGNHVHQFSLQKPHQEFVAESKSIVAVESPGAPFPEIAATCHEVREALHRSDNEELFDAMQFTYPSTVVRFDDAIADFASPFFPDDGRFLSGVLELAEHIYEHFVFDPTATDVTTPVNDVLTMKRGVCQDFAQFAIACIRSMGLPVRYVSGYLLTNPPEGQKRLEGADASHAWISIFDPDLGWIDVDPTNNMICGNQHIVVGHGRDFQDVSLIGGAVTGGGSHQIEVAVTVTPIESVRA